MKKSVKIKKKINNYLFDHQILRLTLEHGRALILSLVSALIFAFAFTAFITPSSNADTNSLTIVTGGVSGITQNINLVLRLCGAPSEITDHNLVQSIGYFVINIPIVIFAWFAIGKKFSFYTAVNVGFSSLFIRLLNDTEFIVAIRNNSVLLNSLLTRTLFGSVVIGMSSAIAFRADVSCGGIDVFTYYFAMRKSTSVGKYSILFNGIVVTCYSILLIGLPESNVSQCVLSLLFSICYLFMTNFVVDAINLRNKKIQVQIITSNEYVADVLLANFTHGATIVDGKGAYSHTDRKIIYMIVSSNEVKKVVNLAKRVDPHAFIAVNPLTQVYGNFFIKPVE